MLFSDIKIIDENMKCLDHCYVGVVDDKIKYVSQEKPNDEEIKSFGQVYDGTNKLLLPGFYNLHSHAAATLIRSYADKQPLNEWLNNWIFPFEAKMTADDYFWATSLGLAEMARYGIVSCSDMYFEGLARIKAIQESKMKCNTSECIISFEDIPFKDHQLYDFTMDSIKNYHNSENSRIKIDMCIHGEYTTKETICRDIGEIAKEYNLTNHIHVSESKSEHEECKERHNGMTPIEYFESLGVLDSPVLIAHGVWLEDKDLEIMKKHDVSMVTCPASNLKLGSGLANEPAIINAGIKLGIGTDGMASNNNHNFLQDMYLAAILNRGEMLDSTLMPVESVFYAATRAGAVIQGREDCGYIKAGYKADLCVMDLSELIWVPGENVLSNMIYAGQGSDICLTMVDGNVVYKDGQWPFLDIEKIKSEVKSRRLRIMSEL